MNVGRSSIGCTWSEHGFDVVLDVGQQRHRRRCARGRRSATCDLSAANAFLATCEMYSNSSERSYVASRRATWRTAPIVAPAFSTRVQVSCVRIVVMHGYALREAAIGRHRAHRIEDSLAFSRCAGSSAFSMMASSCSALRALGLGTSDSGDLHRGGAEQAGHEHQRVDADGQHQRQVGQAVAVEEGVPGDDEAVGLVVAVHVDGLQPCADVGPSPARRGRSPAGTCGRSPAARRWWRSRAAWSRRRTLHWKATRPALSANTRAAASAACLGSQSMARTRSLVAGVLAWR